MRYLPHTSADERRMLDVIGAPSTEALFASIPADHRLKGSLDLPRPMSEPELKRHLRSLAGHVTPIPLVGAGAYPHALPSVVDHLLQRTELYSAYTPYQPEIGQGTLQAIFEFQSMMVELTGLEVANASMYDGATATAEAVLMAHRLHKEQRAKVLVSAALHPEYLAVLRTYVAATGIKLEVVPVDAARGDTSAAALDGLLDAQVAALVVQTPGFFGVVEDLEPLAKAAHAKGALVIAVVTEPVALGIMQAPGHAGADLCVGEGLGLCGGPNYGGPGFGFFTCKKEHTRQMPGRLVGATLDSKGQRGFVLTLSTREQHIRREKATSNICSNQGLCAVAGAMTLACLGSRGLATLARHNLAKTEHLKRYAVKQGLQLHYNGPTFNEVVVEVGPRAAARQAELAKCGLIAGVELGRFHPARVGQVLLCATEVHERSIIDMVVDGLAGKEVRS